MAHRAQKSGFAAEAQAKALAKYDEKVAGEVMQWVKRTVGDPQINTSPKRDDVYETLKDGFVLAKLVDKLCGGIPQKFLASRATQPFKIMEVIGACTKQMAAYGVPNNEIFQTIDLTENQNMWQVVVSLMALSRKAMTHGHDGCAPKESQANVRQFTDEQMKSGNAVIGLQMGYNKGATQKGMNIGNTRHIID